MVPYPSTLDVPHKLVEHVACLIYTRRCEQVTRWRKLHCLQQALLEPAHLRKNETFAQLGAEFGISEATAWRYVDETVDVLPAWASGLRKALTGQGEDDFVIVNGTLIPTDRIAALPGRTENPTAARAHGVIENCLTRQILILADRAYQGAGATVRTPYYHHELPRHHQRYNRNHARLRAPGERAFAQLKTWRLLRRGRCSTNRIGRIAAVHTLLICGYRGWDERGSVSFFELATGPVIVTERFAWRVSP